MRRRATTWTQEILERAADCRLARYEEGDSLRQYLARRARKALVAVYAEL